ncbi:MAG: AbrB/MazE/SpoVT family DNA-binding domain-containing protein [Candidatus Methylomirabilales bacterium]
MVRISLKERGQLTIPAKLRKDLMLETGDLLEVEVRGGHIILKPLTVIEREPHRGVDSQEAEEVR